MIFGINRTNIETLVKYPCTTEICVAEGKPPVDGKNGKVEFHFDINREHKPTILDDGRVDFRELNLIQSIEKGGVLCSLIPPAQGIPGKRWQESIYRLWTEDRPSSQRKECRGFR